MADFKKAKSLGVENCRCSAKCAIRAGTLAGIPKPSGKEVGESCNLFEFKVMKIKFLFSFILFSLFIAGNSHAASKIEVCKANDLAVFQETVIMSSLENSINQVEVSLEIDLLDATQSSVATGTCTVEGNVTVTTESGKSVKVAFKVTASTCKEAAEVMSDIMEALQ
ncbi:hypothetical protein [Haliscomenobacter sp.]|uniref:hypothetical protein n=1 Tax=Haliscomenobacter sp. TaxID=2717303 RepID=UPI003364BB37